MENIVLIRHGKTGSDKNNPQRGLTPDGISKIQSRGLSLKKQLGDNEFMIFASDTFRTLQTADILAESLRIKEIVKHEMRIRNLDRLKLLIDLNEKKGIRPAKTYLTMPVNQLKRLDIETPEELFDRFDKIFNEFKAENVIIVSHEGTLESFLFAMKGFSLTKKTFNKYFGYGDYAILNKIR